jgi:hypothetical protein
MRKVTKVTKMENYRKTNISATGWTVFEDESGKMLDQKMQEKKVHWKDVVDWR